MGLKVEINNQETNPKEMQGTRSGDKMSIN